MYKDLINSRITGTINEGYEYDHIHFTANQIFHWNKSILRMNTLLIISTPCIYDYLQHHNFKYITNSVQYHGISPITEDPTMIQL